MEIDNQLLPIKGHYFLFNAGTAPLVPYLSTYARQLGFSSATVGLIYTVLPIFGLVAKPLFGIIADKFLIQKKIFILFQFITLVSFFTIYFLPESKVDVTVELDCGNGATVLRSCYQNADQINQCKISTLSDQNTTALCDMNCDMTSPKMWETVCEHWHLPQYCYSNTKVITYETIIVNITEDNGCIYSASDNVTLDGYTYRPQCRIGHGYVDINGPCQLICTDETFNSTTILDANMTCRDKLLNFRMCSEEALQSTAQAPLYCKATCDLDVRTPYRLMQICEGWGADAANSCQPIMPDGQEFPSNLSFVGSVQLSSAIAEHDCFFMQLNHIELPDGSTHYPNCISKAQYQIDAELFHSTCEISCNNTVIEEILFEGAQSVKSTESQYTTQFWLFFLLMIISWVGQAVVVTFADAICFNILGERVSLYGKQRLWGSIGFGIFSLLTGTLIDVFSDGAYKNYTVAFVLMFICMSGDIAVSFLIKTESVRMSYNIVSDVRVFLSSLPTVIFMLWTIAVGLCTGLLWNFLFWHLEEIAQHNCGGSEYIKTLQGLVSAIQTFCGETPFMFISGYILKKLGHINMMSLVLFAFGIRFILYAFLTNPWWVLPIELFQGITFGMFYPTMTSYANVISPSGTETTVQGLVGAIFEGVGTSLGSFIGGQLFESHGGWNTFLYFGCGSLVFCFLHILAQFIFKDKYTNIGLVKGPFAAVRYRQPNDMMFIMDEFAVEEAI